MIYCIVMYFLLSFAPRDYQTTQGNLELFEIVCLCVWRKHPLDQREKPIYLLEDKAIHCIQQEYSSYKLNINSDKVIFFKSPLFLQIFSR